MRSAQQCGRVGFSFLAEHRDSRYVCALMHRHPLHHHFASFISASLHFLTTRSFYLLFFTSLKTFNICTETWTIIMIIQEQ